MATHLQAAFAKNVVIPSLFTRTAVWDISTSSKGSWAGATLRNPWEHSRTPLGYLGNSSRNLERVSLDQSPDNQTQKFIRQSHVNSHFNVSIVIREDLCNFISCFFQSTRLSSAFGLADNEVFRSILCFVSLPQSNSTESKQCDVHQKYRQRNSRPMLLCWNKRLLFRLCDWCFA